ncbi:MAG: phosphatidate cytidylyltransferase [Planctomycetota bacterium]
MGESKIWDGGDYSVLRWRLVSAAVLITLLSGLLWLDYHQIGVAKPGFWLLPLASLLIALASFELIDLYGAQGWTPRRGLTVACTLVTFWASAIPLLWSEYPADCPVGRLGWPLLLQIGSLVCILVGEMARFREPGRTLVHVALSGFSVFYLGTLGGFLILLRCWSGNAAGWLALVSMIAIVKMSDTGAYFAGRLCGRHPLAPILSPKKTWEGVFGGVLASVLAAGLFFHILWPRLVGEGTGSIASTSPPAAWRWILYGVLLALAGITGDLAESLLKRDAQIKDAGRRLPGMGGILDLLDSLLVAAPVAYFCWCIQLV